MATDQAIEQAIADLSAAFPETTKRTDKDLLALIGLYQRKFEEVDDRTLTAAIDRVIDTGRYWPRISEIKDAIDHIPQQSPAIEPSEIAYWIVEPAGWRPMLWSTLERMPLNPDWKPSYSNLPPEKAAIAEAEWEAGQELFKAHAAEYFKSGVWPE